ncbi:MAG TPA: GON domain-containing protein [Kofleriaceae bacterium]|nr:GON domain-containing protein [Kofleriaceae bacterium]
MTIALATLASTACTAVESPNDPVDPEPEQEIASVTADMTPDPVTPKKMPSTCQELLDTGTPAVDGEYELHVGGDETKPWLAYCADMASTPKEYLPLVFVLGDHNYSQYTAGGASFGSNVRTNYLRLRIDPATLMVDIGDQAFAISSGSLVHSGSTPVSSMPFGVAMSCDNAASGTADIDLRGTPFTLGSQFAVSGFSPKGTSTLDSRSAQATLQGGGYCGWTSIVNAPSNPFNAAHASVLQLVYTP